MSELLDSDSEGGEKLTNSTAGTSSTTVSQMLGEITWILSQSPLHRQRTIADLEWMVMPAILLEQFRVFRGDDVPVGYAVWAFLSEAAEKRFNDVAMTGQMSRLLEHEWNSGDRIWLVDLIAPKANAENRLQDAMLADLLQNVFPQKSIKFHATDPVTGQREVKEIGG